MSKAKTETIKAIALLSRPREFFTAFEQLKRKQITFSLALSVEHALEFAKSGNFQVCLLSVDVAGVDTTHLPQTLEKELNVQVIAISELRDRRSMSRLSQTKAKNILYSKANALSILSRIELIRKAEAEKSKKLAIKPRPVGTVKQVEQSPAKSNGKVKTRLLTEPSTKLTIQLTPELKFKPVPNLAEQEKFDFASMLSPSELLAVNDSIGTEKFFEQGRFQKILPQKNQNDLIPQDDSSTLEYEPLSADDTQASVVSSLLNVLVRLGQEQKQADISPSFTRSLVISFSSSSLIGTFVIAQQNENANLNTAESELYLQLKSAGFQWNHDQVVVQELSEFPVPSEFITSGVYVSSFCDIGEVAITYYPESITLPNFVRTPAEEFEINLTDLVKDSKINFDLFINLKLNSRSLHYLKVGNILSEKHLEKLKSGKVGAWTPAAQLANFEQYVLFHRLMNLMSGSVEDESDTAQSA